MNPTPGTQAWFAQVTEAIIDPNRPIIDPHHHLWDRPDKAPYLLPELWSDTGAGHNIQKTVFVECGGHYRTDGPELLKPVGETEFIAGLRRPERRRRVWSFGCRGHCQLCRSDARRCSRQSAGGARKSRAGALPRHPPRRGKPPHTR